MHKKVIKIVSFLFVLLVLLLLLSKVFVPKNNTKEAGVIDEAASGILGEEDNTIDVLFIGNSVIYTSIIPMQLWEEHGITSYVLFSPGQPLPDTLYYTYKSTQKQKPKYVVLEASNMFLNTDISNSARNILSIVLPIFRYHDRWKTMHFDDIYKDIDYTRVDDNKGYGFSLNVRPADTSDYMKETNEVERISKLNKLYVKALNEYCKMNDMELLLVASPSPDNWNYAKHNALVKFSEENNIEFVNMNLVKEINIDWNNDTRDAGDHLNYYGAKKTTEYFGKYLSDKGKLTDHRDDKKYESWNVSLNKFNDMVNKQMGN